MCGDFILSLKISKGFIYIKVLNFNFFKIIHFLKLHLLSQFKSFVDLCVIDNLSHKERFELHYIFLSMFFNSRLILFFSVKPFDLINSATSLYKSANWIEREAWDMFGIYFDNHPDLRKILTDYGFEGFPLRKDFPLSGYFEVRYDDSRKQVIYENLELTQTLRYFNFINPWHISSNRYLAKNI